MGDDPRTMDQRRADLLMLFLSGRLGAIPAEDLADADTNGDTEDEADTHPDDVTDTDTAGGMETHTAGGMETADAAESATVTDPVAPVTDVGTDDSPPSWTGPPPRPVNPGKPLVNIVMPFATLRGEDDQPATCPDTARSVLIRPGRSRARRMRSGGDCSPTPSPEP